MSALQSLLERWLPFLRGARLTLHLPARPSPSSAGAPSSAQEPPAHGALAERLEAGAPLSELDLPDQTLHGTALQRVSLERSRLPRLRLVYARLIGCRLQHVQLPDALWQAVDAEGLSLSHCDLSQAQLAGSSLRETSLEDTNLRQARLTLVDASGTRWRRVDAREMLCAAVDFSFASLEDVVLCGADLRGCSFVHAHLNRVDFSDAQLDRTDFRGAQGLEPHQRAALLAAGARLYDGWLAQTLARLLGVLSPGMPLERLDRIATRLARTLNLLALLGVGAGIGLLIWRGPVRESRESAPAPAQVPALVYEPTSEEISRTREGLQRLREAIQRAFESSAARGHPRYPTLEELAENSYDADGVGPEREQVPLLPGGLPPNFLTPGEGAAPYCNEPPSQDTLTGDDTDWHYCPETGRIYACGGFTRVPTLTW